MAITATFPTITFPHRGIETKDVFVTSQETAQDLLAGDLTTNLNLFKTEANALEVNVNAKEASAVAAEASAIAASNFQGTWTNKLTVIGQSWEYLGVIYGVLVAGTDSPITTPANWFALTIAQAIKNTPAGSISATTVQDALNELDTEKAPKDSPVFTGQVSLDSSIIFEGATDDAFETTLSVTNPTADRTITLKDESGIVAYLSDITASFIPSGVRQIVQSGSVDTSGFANFISIGTGLNVNIDGTIPVVIHAAGGAISADRLGTISADKTLLLPASNTSYIYETVATDGTCTSGSTTLAPIYQFGGTPAVTNGQFTFNIGEMKGYLGNGTTAPQVWMTFTGEAVTGVSTVTSVITYALNGISIIKQATLALGTAYNFNANIGTYMADISNRYFVCKTADVGFSIGNKVPVELSASATASGYGSSVSLTSINTIKLHTAGTAIGSVANAGTTSHFTATNWSFECTVKRSF